MKPSLYILLFCTFLHFSFTGTRHDEFGLSGGNGDTLMAEVSYGDNFLLNGRYNLTNEELDAMIDSLKKFSTETVLINDLCFFREIRQKGKTEIEHKLDSLFRADSIPYGLINELNLLLLNYQSGFSANAVSVSQFMSDESGIPCNQLYAKHWDIYHPFHYPVELSAGDSTLLIKLTDSGKGHSFSNPVSQQTINKYGGLISSAFGWRDGRNHNGVDIELDRWDTIRCAFDGKVRMARNYAGYGKVVVVRHYNGLETLYAHMQRIGVKSGESVKAGDVLGWGGSTGNSTGSHLHFEIRYKGLPLNPANVIDFREKCLLSDTLLIRKMRNSVVGIPVGVNYHTVERGDYLQKIAQRYGLSIRDLCALNNISSGTRLRIGQRLRVSN